MAEQRTCPVCNSRVPKDAPLGHCPTCLLRHSVSPAPGPTGNGNGRNRWRAHVIGDFELVEEVGCGGMGVVYRARQISLNRPVAVKMISPSAFGSGEMVDRFLQEAQVAGGLNHPNIVSIYSVGDFEDQPYICMELIEGSRLDQHITKRGFVWEKCAPEEKHRDREVQAESARLIAKVARAVDYAHQHGVLHRDIKPANILLDIKGEPHLTDFGLAKLLGPGATRRTATGAIMGTPCYMAPEQAAGEGNLISTASDIYSLGAILYEMLTGSPPFHGKTPLETISRVVNEQPKHPTTLNMGVNRDLATICMACLEKDPQRRHYKSAGELADDLERWLRKEPIEARPVGSIARTWRWCRREPALAGLIVGVFLLLLTVAIVAYALYRKEVNTGEVTVADFRQEMGDLVTLMVNLFEKPETPSITLSPENVDTVLRRKHLLVPSQRLAPRVVLGIRSSNMKRNPERILETYALLLDYLGTNTASTPMRLHLTIFKDYSNAVAALHAGEVNVLRLSPAAYLSARQEESGLMLLVQEQLDHRPDMFTSIFAPPNANIGGWADLKGRVFLFPARDLLPDDVPVKSFLFDRGLRATDFERCLSIGTAEEILAQVRTNHSAFGATRSDDINNILRAAEISHWPPPLTVLASNLPSAAFPWVASPKLDPAVAQAIRQSLCGLTNSATLSQLLGSPSGFREARDEDFKAFEEQLRRANLFDGKEK